REDLQRIALDAILRLREQIQYLAAIAGITAFQPQPEPAPVLRTASVPTFSNVEPVRMPRPAIASALGGEDGYEEDLFGDD
ncbi:MAG: hypothetical protein F6K28_52655, partial [Microcoleus sp. SIO2G3]|nr:hypothetical protein [Microcoleus sp. SIO2G3]